MTILFICCHATPLNTYQRHHIAAMGNAECLRIHPQRYFTGFITRYCKGVNLEMPCRTSYTSAIHTLTVPAWSRNLASRVYVYTLMPALYQTKTQQISVLFIDSFFCLVYDSVSCVTTGFLKSAYHACQSLMDR